MHDFFSKVIKRLLSLSSFYILVEKMATPELRQGCRLISFTMALAQVGAWYSEKKYCQLERYKEPLQCPRSRDYRGDIIKKNHWHYDCTIFTDHFQIIISSLTLGELIVVDGGVRPKIFCCHGQPLVSGSTDADGQSTLVSAATTTPSSAQHLPYITARHYAPRLWLLLLVVLLLPLLQLLGLADRILGKPVHIWPLCS